MCTPLRSALWRSSSPSQGGYNSDEQEASVELEGLSSDIVRRLEVVERQCAQYKVGFEDMKARLDCLERKDQQDSAARPEEVGGGRTGPGLFQPKDLRAIEVQSPSMYQWRLDEAPDELESESEEELLMSNSKNTFSQEYNIFLPESIYSDMILTWTRGRAFPIFTSTLLWFVCISFQFSFIHIVYRLAKDDIQQKSSSFHDWESQFTKGGYKLDTVFANHTIEQYCIGDAWTWETDAIERYTKYAALHFLSVYLPWNLSDGFVLGWVSLMLWAGYCTAELRDIADYLTLLFLPGKSLQRSFSWDSMNGRGKIVGLPVGTKIVILVVAACRIGTVVCLVVAGCRFLCYTTKLTDFIFNSVALTFIADIDDLCFRLLAPDKQVAVKLLEPPVVRGKTAQTLDEFAHFAEIASLVSVVGIAAIATMTLNDFAWSVWQAAKTVCALNFNPRLKEALFIVRPWS